MADEHIRVEHEGAVVRLVIDRPAKKNALTGAMYVALAEAIDAAGADSADTRAIVLAGHPGAFTAGNDLNDFLSQDTSTFETSPPGRFLQAITTTTVPLIAAVDGFAVGVGATLLLHCDAVFVTERTALSFPFAQLGLVPEAASSLLLPAAIGQVRAASALLLGEKISGTDAVAWGLANALVEPEAVVPAAMEVAERLAALSPDAVRTTKRLMRAPVTSVQERMREEGREFNRLLQGETFKRVASTFVNKG